MGDFRGVIQSPVQKKNNYIETQLRAHAIFSKKMSSTDMLFMLASVPREESGLVVTMQIP